MFEDSTFESMGAIQTRTGGWMMATFALNGTILLALVLLPLIYPQMLPSMVRSIRMETPPPPVEPVRLQPVPVHTAISAPQSGAPVIDMRRVIPTLNRTPGIPDDNGPIDLGNSSVNGNPTGATGSPLGNGSNIQVVQLARSAPAPVSQGVMNGLLVFKPMPVYPPIALASRTQGTVVLEAIISKSGTIENLRVMSGPAMLQQAALDAVRRWIYRPYLLNRQPVEVETTVNVVFTLN
jgi:periplasmic protein TonB